MTEPGVSILVGLACSVLLDGDTQALGLWGYSDYMPTLTVFGHTVGLSPVVQVTTLPALSLHLATRYPHGFSSLRTIDQEESL